MPGNPALIGGVLCHQWAVLDSAAIGLLLVTSDAVKVLVGS